MTEEQWSEFRKITKTMLIFTPAFFMTIPLIMYAASDNNVMSFTQSLFFKTGVTLAVLEFITMYFFHEKWVALTESTADVKKTKSRAMYLLVMYSSLFKIYIQLTAKNALLPGMPGYPGP